MSAKRSVPKCMELIFDSIYLVSAAVVAVYLLCLAQPVQQLWGVMAGVLAVGDAFHLVPRMAAASTGNVERFEASMGVGKMVTSITMTVFYVILWHAGLQLFSVRLPVLTFVMYGLAGVRILLCLLPQNKWKQREGKDTFGIVRNIPFVLQGLLVIALYAACGAQVPGVRFVWLAVLISFLCYVPVVLWVSTNPKLGMLMLPKTCVYLWLIFMGLSLS